MRSRVLITLLTVSALVPTLDVAHARQPKKLKVYISADMEGISGVSTVLFTATDMTEASKFLEAVTGLNAY